MSVILKEGHSLKGKDLVPLIEQVKQLPTGTELARLTPTRPIKDLTFDGLREEFHNLTEKSMDEILASAGLPVDINNGRAVLHHAIVLANEVGEPSAQDEDQTLPKSAAVHRPTKRPSDQAHETSSKYPKFDGPQWFESHRQKSKWLIGQNRCVLVNKGCFSHIRDHMLQAEILSDHEVQEIEETIARYKQMSRFVDKLCQKSDEVIEKCCEVIREADPILYDQLQWPRPPSPDQAHQAEVDGLMSDDLGKIQQELKSWYTGQLSHFHPIPWCGLLEMDLDHVYTNLKMVKGQKHQLSSRVEPKTPRDIIDTKGLLELLFQREGRAVTFIQGLAGVGKSTLCRRLAYLWATNNSCIHGRHFDLVLLLEARSIDEDNLKQSIMRQLFPEDYDMTEETVYKWITTCRKNALLIIDGMDELRQEGKMAVQKLLEGRFLRNTNIILTGRPESMKAFIKYASVHLEVCGFTGKDVKSYIRKYFPQRHKELEPAVFDSLRCLTQSRFHYIRYFDSSEDCDSSEEKGDDKVFGESSSESDHGSSEEERDDEVFGESSSESDHGSSEEERDDELRDLCVNPLTTCLICLLVEEKGRVIPSNENDILEEVITLTLDRYVSKQSDRNQSVTTEELLSKACDVAWRLFKRRELRFTETFIKERYTGGMGEHLLKSGLINRDFTMSRYHTSCYCYFSHRSIQDYLCAKYLVNVQQKRLDKILMDLPVTHIVWGLDTVIKLLYHLKEQRERVRRYVQCILHKCPVYRKLKPGFQKYVGRLTSEERMELNVAPEYGEIARWILSYSDENTVLSVLSASDEMLRLSYEAVCVELYGKPQNLLALPVLYSSSYVGWDFENYALPNDFKRHDFSFSYKCRVEHKMSHMYNSVTTSKWTHLDSFRDIADCFKWECDDLPIVLSVLVLPGCMDVLFVKRVIDTLNSRQTKLTLFLIVPQLQCEDLSRMRLLSMIRSGVSPDIQVCCEYPNVPVRHKYTNRTVCREHVYLKVVEIKYSNPVAVHHMYYNKYCPF